MYPVHRNPAKAARVRPALLSFLGGAAAGGALLFVFALLMVRANLCAAYAPYFATAICCAVSLVTAYLAARLRGSGGLFCGLFGAAVCLVPLLICAVESGFTSAGTLLRLLLVVPSGVFGGIAGQARCERTPRHHAR